MTATTANSGYTIKEVKDIYNKSQYKGKTTAGAVRFIMDFIPTATKDEVLELLDIINKGGKQ